MQKVSFNLICEIPLDINLYNTRTIIYIYINNLHVKMNGIATFNYLSCFGEKESA